MFSLTLKEVMAWRSRLVGVALAITLGVALMIGTLVFNATLRASFTDVAIDANRGVDAVVRARPTLEHDDDGIVVPIDAAILERVVSAPQVGEATGRRSSPVKLVGRDGRVVDGEGLEPIRGVNWVTSSQLNPYRVTVGHAPTGPDEIVLDPDSARRAGYEPGDRASVVTKEGVGRFVVSGLAAPDDADSTVGSFVFFQPDAAARLLGTAGTVDDIVVAGRDGVTQEVLVDAIRRILPRGVTATTGRRLERELRRDIEEDFAPFATFMLSFVVIVVLVSAFIINNTFSITAAQRARQHAMLRALGASRPQVTMSALLEAAIVGTLASAVGIAAGLGVAKGLAALLGPLGLHLPDRPTVIHTGDVLRSFCVGLVVTLVAAYRPARRAGRVAPIAAIRGIDTERVGRRSRVVRFVIRCLAAPLTIFGAPGDLAIRNSVRNHHRTVRAAAALTIGVALVSSMLVVSSSVKASFTSSITTAYLGTHVVDAGLDDSSGLGAGVAESLRNDPRVRAVARSRMSPVEIDGSGTELFAFSADTIGSLFQLGSVRGSVESLGDDGIAVAAGTARADRLRLGSKMRISFPSGDADLVVKAIYDGSDEWMGDQFVDIAVLDRFAPGTLDHRLYVDAPDDALRSISLQPGLDVMDREQFVERVSGGIDQILALIFALLALAVFIAFLGIANTMALSVHERSRELGLLRAVGMSRSQVRTMIRAEAVVIALLGVATGVATGTAVGRAVVQALHSEGIRTFAVPTVAFAAVAATAAVSAVAAAARPARRGARANVLAAAAGR